MAATASTFRALVTRAKATPATVVALDAGSWPKKSTVKTQPGDCDTIVKVEYSTVNYKDAMVVTGNYPGMRQLPMVGGIDLVGSVLSTEAPALKVGEKVLINGFGIGTDHFGGFAEIASVRGKWCQPLSDAGDPSPLDAARIGTAGYTAMLCVDAVAGRVGPDQGPVVVSGATGGVGSFAVHLLSRLGYHVVAATGKAGSESGYLTGLGAKEVVDRSVVQDGKTALAKELYAGAVDTVGGAFLANLLSKIKYGGVVAPCGMVGGMDLPASVAPFILRGVAMMGIDSVFQDMETRQLVYKKYVPVLKSGNVFDAIGGDQTVGLEEVPEVARKMLQGQHRGRYVVKI